MNEYVCEHILTVCAVEYILIALCPIVFEVTNMLCRELSNRLICVHRLTLHEIVLHWINPGY